MHSIGQDGTLLKSVRACLVFHEIFIELLLLLFAGERRTDRCPLFWLISSGMAML